MCKKLCRRKKEKGEGGESSLEWSLGDSCSSFTLGAKLAAMENWITGSFLPPNFVTFTARQIFFIFIFSSSSSTLLRRSQMERRALHGVWCMTPSHNIHQTAIGQAVVGITMLLHPSHNHNHRLKIVLQRAFLGRHDIHPYLIIVTDATDAVSVNFSGRCKFLLI